MHEVTSFNLPRKKGSNLNPIMVKKIIIKSNENFKIKSFMCASKCSVSLI